MESASPIRPDAEPAPAPPRAQASATPAVAVRGVAVRYGRRSVLDGVDLEIAPGEVYALLGRNGSGKSSLVRTLLGLQPPAAGSVRLLGVDPWQQRASLMERTGVVAHDYGVLPFLMFLWVLSWIDRD